VFNGLGGFGLGGGLGYGYGSYVNGLAGFSSSESVGLGQGVGDEGPIKTMVARTIAEQANPEYAAKAAQNLTAAEGRASNYAVVKNSLGLKGGSGDIAEAGFSKPVAGKPIPVTVTRVLDGKAEKIDGELVNSDGDWLTLKVPGGTRRLLKATVVDVLEKN
jgi:hypothetical protein